MATSAVETSTVTVGTLKHNPSMFFDQMESMMDQQLHQHTASMFSMPSNILRNGLQEVVRERDEETFMKHLSLPENDDMEFETDDDFSITQNSEEDKFDKEHDKSTAMQQTSSNASTVKGAEEKYDFFQTMDTENFEDDITGDAIPHNRDRSGGLSKEDVNHIAQRPSIRVHRLGSTMHHADTDDEEPSHTHTHSHTHSDHWEHEHSDHKEHSTESSHTVDSERHLWNAMYLEGAFQECNIRFEEDDWCDGKKPPAAEFVSLRFFFQFVYDQVHCYSQFLLDTSLPMYAEWKKMRKVTIRPKALQTVDYALKECLKCSQSIKSLVRNTLILCLDEDQPLKTWSFEQCENPAIESTEFNVGAHSMMAAWDLFDAGSTPSSHDWVMALSLDEGVAQTLSSCFPDLSHLSDQWKRNSLAYHRGKTYQYLMIAEFLNVHKHNLQFGGGPLQWKKVKKKFIERHGDKYQNELLTAFDKLTFFINPPLNKLRELLNDTDTKKERRIIAEPIMWLFYMVDYLIVRQARLTHLYMVAMKYTNDNTSNQRVVKCVLELAKQAKDESERLRAVMTRLPETKDLKQTLIDLVNRRDPQGKEQYTKSLKGYKF